MRSQSRVSSGAGAVFVPEDAQHKLEQGTELGQQSIAPTASHAWGTPTQQELLVLFSLLSVIRTGALFLSCTASRPPQHPDASPGCISFQGASPVFWEEKGLELGG